MFNTFMEMISYPFMVRAMVVGILVSLCASLLGSSLVLKRYSMIGDGLSHVGFAALAVAYAMNAAPLMVSIPVCVLAAFLLLRMNENSKIKGDAATALMCSGSLAIGVMTVSLTTGMNTDVCNYMFGSILAMSKSDVIISIGLSIIVILLFLLFYPRIFAVTFDENFAKAIGTRSDLYNMLIAFLTAITVVLGMRMMGTLLISSLIVFPSLSAMRVCRRFKSVIFCSAGISVLCFVAGIYVSYEYSTPTGASIVIANMLVFVLLAVIEALKERRQSVMQFAIICLVLSGLLTGCGRQISYAVNQTEEDSTEDNTTAIVKENATYSCNIEADKAAYDGTVDITVGDQFYATQINDWYLNFNTYAGKVVEIEGYYINDFAPYDFIGRYGPTCPYCQGGYVDFEFLTDEDMSQYVSGQDWIRVTGILRSGDDAIGGPFYYIEALSIEKMDSVGVDTVVN